MKLRRAPLLAMIMALSLGAVPVLAQLPPTNMGKFVHQPGDNQYSDQTQSSRHGTAAPPRQQVVQRGGGGGYVPTPATSKPDATLEPIAADEPVPAAGFPPLPDRLDLPVSNGSSWTSPPRGGGYNGGGGTPGMGGGGGIQPTFHQHYGHVAPGAYLQQQQQGGHGYYKARTPASDYYNTNTGGAPGTPPYTGASQRDLSALGKEPRLNDQSTGGMPDAPAPVVVNQSTTQDLSLPDDDFAYHPKKPGIGHEIHQVLQGPLNSVGGMAGVHF